MKDTFPDRKRVEAISTVRWLMLFRVFQVCLENEGGDMLDRISADVWPASPLDQACLRIEAREGSVPERK